jgi:uncharacterized protein (UPF0303 family)
MEIERDLARIAEQERALQFTAFDAATAWDLGGQLKAVAEARRAGLTIEIRLNGRTLFFYEMVGAAPVNADWARRKRNVVELFQRSSYAVGLGLQREGTTLEAKQGLPLRDYAVHGGSFPLLIAGVGCVGAITVSGLPQREDHSLIVAALAEMLGRPLAELALDHQD